VTRYALTVVDEGNYRDHLDKIALLFGLTEEDIRLEPGLPFDRADVGRVTGEAYALYERELGAGAGAVELWVFAGALARPILRDLPCQGLTLMEGDGVVSVLVSGEGPEILGRLFVHEWCHARRLTWAGLKSQAAYVRYLADPVAWLYEETLAIATERRLFPHLSWEEAAGFAYNPRFRNWAAEGFLPARELLARTRRGAGGKAVAAGAAGEEAVAAGAGEAVAASEAVAAMLERRAKEGGPAAFIYYLAYGLARAAGADRRLAELMNLGPADGLDRLFDQARKGAKS